MSCTVLSTLDLSPADAAVEEVLDGKFFFSVEEPIKEGTMPTVAVAPVSDAYPAGYHVGNVGGLPAIDADLAAGNIKDGVTIFGTLGTFINTLNDEDLGIQYSTIHTGTFSTIYRRVTGYDIAGSTAVTVNTKTATYETNALVLAISVFVCSAEDASSLKLQLHMDGVQIAESGFISTTTTRYTLTGSRSMSGSKVVETKVENYNVAARWFAPCAYANGDNFDVLAVGAVYPS